MSMTFSGPGGEYTVPYNVDNAGFAEALNASHRSQADDADTLTVDNFGVLLEPQFVEAPPERARGNFGRADAVRKLLPALREKPFKWAAIMRHQEKQRVISVSSNFAAGTFGHGCWQTVVRVDRDTGEHVLYARYEPINCGTIKKETT